MARLRTFIAMETPEEIQHQVMRLADRLRPAGADVKWVEPENLHWTLKFLGEVEVTDSAEICRRLARIAAQTAPIDLMVEHVGAFPNIERPRTLWIGASEGSEPMVALYDAIELALAELGFNREQRRFTPHLTFGRVRSTKNMRALAQLLQQNADFSAGPMVADEVVLFSSELSKEGPRYEAIGRLRLEGE